MTTDIPIEDQIAFINILNNDAPLFAAILRTLNETRTHRIAAEAIETDLTRYREVNAELENELKLAEEENSRLRADMQTLVDNIKDKAA